MPTATDRRRTFFPVPAACRIFPAFRSNLNTWFPSRVVSQRFPAALFNDWDQIRTNLNSLARIYKLETLAVLEPPAAGGGGRANRLARAAPAPGGGLTGYIVDQRCAARGKGMWSNTACVEKCVRDGDKIVLVTEEGKVYQISNQDKIPAENYGQIVTVAGKVDGETITVAAVQ